MAYSRFGESDMYIIMSSKGFLFCVVCRLDDSRDFTSAGFSAYSTAEMIAHIDSHRNAGHDVLDGLESKLLEDDLENFPNRPNHTNQTQPTPPSVEE